MRANSRSLIPSIRRPASHTSPPEGRSRPPSTCNKVDLPHPLGPIPATVYAALSHALELPERAFAAFLQGPPQFAAGAAFKSRKALKLPEQVDFLEELKRDPNVSAADHARWAGEEK